MPRLLGLLVLVVCLVAQSEAADVAAGKEKAAACTACHGANGVSVSPDIPNLAGQKGPYLKAQLEAFRSGARKNQLMNAMAGPLSNADIENLTAFFASLPPGTESARSPVGEELAKALPRFPADYKTAFTQYTTINFPETKQVRTYLANDVALRAARAGATLPDGSVLFVEVFRAKLDGAGNPVKGPDGFFEKDKLLFFTAMERDKGWGDAIPQELRNENWRYAVFTAEGKAREGVAEARCLACHKPKDAESYLFTLKELAARARR